MPLFASGRDARAIGALTVAVALGVTAVLTMGNTKAPHATVVPAGNPRWSTQLPAEFTEDTVTAQFSDDVILLSGEPGLLAYRRSTGEPLWRRDDPTPPNDYFRSYSAVLSGDALVFAYTSPDHERTIEMLDPATGAVRGTVESPYDGGSEYHLAPTTLIEVGCDIGCVTSAYRTGDAELAWRRDAWALLPAAVPLQQQQDDTASGFAWSETPDPDATFIVFNEGGWTQVVDPATGTVSAEWPNPRASTTYQIDGGNLISGNIEDDLTRGVDPATGAELWAVSLPEPPEDPLLRATAVAGLIIERRADGGASHLVDTATGEILPIATAGWPLLAVSRETVVGYDAPAGILTAVAPASGDTRWTVPIDLDIGKGGQHGRSYADDEHLVITAAPDRPQLAPPRTWPIPLDTGAATTLPGAAVGIDDGAVLTISADHRLQLTDLA